MQKSIPVVYFSSILLFYIWSWSMPGLEFWNIGNSKKTSIELFQPVLNLSDGGKISGDEEFCNPYDPIKINSTASATATTNLITYQWEQSTDSLTFVEIPGATNLTYNPTNISTSMYYRRKASITDNPQSQYSNIVRKIINPTSFFCLDNSEWEFGCDDSYVLSPSGKGIKGVTNPAIRVLNPTLHDLYLVEAVFSGGAGSPEDVTFSNEDGVVRTAVKEYFTGENGVSGIRYFRALFPPSDSIFLEYDGDINTAEALIAYTINERENQASFGEFVHSTISPGESFTFTYQIPETVNERNIYISIPISGMEDNGSELSISLSANGVSKIDTIDSYRGDSSLNVHYMNILNVPPDATDVVITVTSPTINGQDALLHGAISGSTVCDDELVLLIDSDADCPKVGDSINYTYTLINFADYFIQNLRAPSTLFGEIPFENDTIFGNTQFVFDTFYVVQPSDYPGEVRDSFRVLGWNFAENGIKPIWDIGWNITKVCQEICDNGVDDDGDMLVDCDDPDCVVTTVGTIAGNEQGCGPYNPSEITNTGSATGYGNIQYQWQTSPDGIIWSNFTSATLATFDPPTIAQTTHYRRGARNEFCTTWSYSNVVEKVVVFNYTNAGQVAGDQSECGGYDPEIIGSVSPPSGGNGTTPVYQWQSKVSGGTWTNIAGANLRTFDPTFIIQTHEYRRAVSASPCTNLIFSNIVTKEVLSVSSANIISHPTGNLCSNTTHDFTAQNVGSGLIYYWDFGAYASSANSTGIGPHHISFDVPKNAESTVLDVELVVNENGCETRDTVEIVILAGIDTTSIITTSPTSCNAPDGSITINADYFTGNNIEVTLDNGSSWETANQLVFNNLTAGSYDIQIRYVGQTCVYDFGKVTLSDISIVSSGIVEDYDLECDDLTHSFSATADATIDAYTWNFGSGASPASATGAGPHNITYSTYGSKAVSLTTAQNGCNTVYLESFELIQNVSDGGEIAEDQFLCGSNDPDPLTNISNATGGTGGTISYQWQQRTKATPFIWGNWGNIPGETGLSYDPPVLTEETQYRRMASRTSCDGVPTNVVSVTPSTEPDANINNFASVCPGQAYSNDVSINDNNVLSPSYSIYTPAQNGSVNIFDDGSFIYEPNTLFCGTDKFVYEVCNHAGSCCDTATVNVDLTDPAAPVLYNIPEPEFIHCDEDVPTPPFVLALENCLQVELGMDEVSTQGLSNCELHTYDITRVWTATDYCGLSANSSQTIMVEDITAPGIYRVYTLPNGTKMIGGFVDHVGERWKHITLPITFATRPVIFTQVITDNDASATSVQLKNISKSQFDIRLMDEEANDAVVHGRERIAWIAIEQGTGTLNNPFEVGELPVDSNPKVINFSQPFSTNPVLIANTQTAYSSEPVEVRIPNLNNSNASVYLQEDQSADVETTHSIEGVGYAAFGDEGNLELPSGEIFGETGKTSFPGDVWKEITLSHAYKNPIVIATISTENDDKPVAVRIKDVTPSSFYMKIDGWNYQTNTHGTEEISYVVIEGSVPFDQTVACDNIPPTLQIGTEIITVDNCDVAVNIEYSETPNTNNCAPGNIITRTWYSEDECGNSVSYSRQIAVFDNVDPEFTVPADVTIECEDNINDLGLTGDVTDESDNCATGIEATYMDLYNGAFVCDSSFTVVREWTLHDNCGNSVTKYQNINIIHRGVYLSAKMFLQGALFNSTDSLMKDDLRAQGLLPLVEPYSEMAAYHHIGGGSEAVNPSVFTVTGPDAIVDWIFIELRNSLQNDSIVATRSGLIQRDGDIVDVDGVSPIEFDNAQPGQYNIAIRHRNHLGAMTLYPKRLKTDPADESTFDFTVEPNVSAANVLSAIDFDLDGLVYLCDRGGTVPVTIQVPVDSVGTYAQDSTITCGPCGQYRTINDGDWGDPSVWENGNIPPMPVGTGTEVVINHELSNPGYFEINGEGMVWIEKGALLAEDDLKVYDSGKLYILDSDVETNGFFYLNSSPTFQPRLSVVGSRFTVRNSYQNNDGYAFFKNACVTAEQGYEVVGQEVYQEAQIDVLSGDYKIFNTQNSISSSKSRFHIQNGNLENLGQFKGNGAIIWVPSGNLINQGSWENAIAHLCVSGTISSSIPQNAIPVVNSCNEMPLLFNEFICGNVIDQMREEQVVSDPDSPVVKPWGNFATVATSQGQALWSGDYNADRQTIYQGPSNDVSHLFVQVLTDPNNIEALPNYIRVAYDEADIDLDGKVIYQGPDNERSKLLFRTILITPGNVQLLPNFIISEQIPR